jgi:hypothetical protein
MAAVRFDMSVCLSVSMEQLENCWKCFNGIGKYRNLLRFVDPSNFCLKLDRIIGRSA